MNVKGALEDDDVGGIKCEKQENPEKKRKILLCSPQITRFQHQDSNSGLVKAAYDVAK